MDSINLPLLVFREAVALTFMAVAISLLSILSLRGHVFYFYGRGNLTFTLERVRRPLF